MMPQTRRLIGNLLTIIFVLNFFSLALMTAYAQKRSSSSRPTGCVAKMVHSAESTARYKYFHSGARL